MRLSLIIGCALLLAGCQAGSPYPYKERLADAKIDASYQMLSSGKTGEDRVVVFARTFAHENHLEVCAAMLYFGDQPFKYRRLLGDTNSFIEVGGGSESPISPKFVYSGFVRFYEPKSRDIANKSPSQIVFLFRLSHPDAACVDTGDAWDPAMARVPMRIELNKTTISVQVAPSAGVRVK